MSSCFASLAAPYQNARPGAVSLGSGAWWPTGAVAYFDFVAGRYMLNDRTYTGPFVPLTGATLDWSKILVNPAGANTLFADVFARVPTGSYDVLRIQSDAADWTTEASTGCGLLLTTSAAVPFLAEFGVFPAGLLSQAEKDALAVTAPVFYATTETSASSYNISEFEELFCFTDTNVVTVNLPPSPTEGFDCRVIRDGANSVIVVRNGSTIAGLAEDYEIDVNKSMSTFKFRNGNWYVNFEELA